MNTLLEARLKRIISLSCAEETAARVLKLGEKPDLTGEDILGVLENDPALAAMLLRIANSPLYARRRLIGSLRQAILELSEAVSLTVLLESVRLIRIQHAHIGVQNRSVWRRARVTGAFAGLVGRAVREDDLDALYMAGMLREVGILALLEAYPESYAKVLARVHDRARLLKTERTEWDTTHVEAGAWLARHWRLPPIVVDSIELTHNGDSLAALEADYRRRLACVWLSAIITDWCLDEAHEGTREKAGNDAGVRQLTEAKRRFPQLSGIQEELQLTDEQLDGVMQQAAATTPAILEGAPPEPWTAEQRRTFHQQRRHALRLRRLQNQHALEKVGAHSQYLRARNMLLEETARRDAMTALFNRAYFNEVLQREFTLSQSYNSAFNLALIDLDRFKAVNDNAGHPVGDRLLTGIAAALQSCVRNTDIVARFGGDEFALIAPGTRASDAITLCERLLAAVRDHCQSDSGGEQVMTTASIGLVTEDQVRDFADVDSLMAGVDTALYTAKRQGGNQLVVGSEASAPSLASGKPGS